MLGGREVPRRMPAYTSDGEEGDVVEVSEGALSFHGAKGLEGWGTMRSVSASGSTSYSLNMVMMDGGVPRMLAL